jgi:serine/threonine-protein kinase
MSPEQIRGEKVDARTDIYSLGLTFYQILSGVQPFEGSNYSAIITRKLTEGLTPLKKIVPDLPQRLVTVVNKMTDRSSARRFQSMDELVGELTEFGTESDITTEGGALTGYLKGKQTTEVPIVTPSVTSRARSPIYAAVAAVIIVAAVFAAFRLRPEREMDIVEIPVDSIPVAVLTDTTIGTGAIFVTSDPPGAAIAVDGVNRQASTPASISSLEPGEHELSVILKGYVAKTRTVRVNSGETSRAAFTLIPLTGAGFLKVGASPWAAVYVDGDSVDTTPFNRLLRLETGTHEIVFCNPDFPDYISEVEISDGGTTDVFVDLTRTWSRPLPSGSAGYARISVEPWAAVYIDGDSVDTTPFNRLLRLEQGRHRLVLSNPSFPDWEMFLEVVKGETSQISVDLANEFGYLMLNVEPWADVYVDGVYRDTTPLSRPIPVLPGEHLIKLVGPSSPGWEKRLEFERGETVVEKVVMPRG